LPGRKFLADSVEAPQEKLDLVFNGVGRPAHEDDARFAVSTDSKEFAEVRVGGHEHAIFGVRCIHHGLVECTKQPDVADVQSIVTGDGEKSRHACRQRLVDEDLQPAEARGSSRSSTAAAA
jgi:hypothetical protein